MQIEAKKIFWLPPIKNHVPSLKDNVHFYK